MIKIDDVNSDKLEIEHFKKKLNASLNQYVKTEEERHFIDIIKYTTELYHSFCFFGLQGGRSCAKDFLLQLCDNCFIMHMDSMVDDLYTDTIGQFENEINEWLDENGS